jgi:thiol-disulfide isomerase/thioredoxin
MIRIVEQSRSRGALRRLVSATGLALLLVAATPGCDKPAQPAPANTAEGPELILADAARVLEEVRKPGASAVLVNVWATWCLPCREEFPDLMRVYKDLQPKGLRLVLVSADFDDDREKQVQLFLRRYGVDFPSFLKEQQDQEFIDGLSPEWSGALPGSLLYDGSGNLQAVWEGAETYTWMKQKVEKVIGS